METCRIGAHFPQLGFESVAGGLFQLPDDVAGSTAVILFYRGHW